MMLIYRENFVFQKITRIIETIRRRLQAYRIGLLRLGVIFGILVITPLIGILAAKIDPLLVLVVAVAPLALVGIQFIFPRLELTPVVILFTAAFVPVSLSTGTESRLVLSFLLTLVFVGYWLLKMMIVEKHLSLIPSPVNKPLLGFIFIVLFSVIWSTVFRDPLVDPTLLSKKFTFVQIASALTMIMLPGAFLLVTNHINTVKLFQIMTVMMLIAGTIALIRRLGLAPLKFVNDNGLFTMWIVNLAMGLALFKRKLSWWWRGLLLVVAGGWIYFRFGLQISWLAGWLPAFVAVGVLTFMRSKKLTLITLIALIIFIGLNANYYLGTVVGNESDESGGTRMAAWEVNWRVTGKHLLFGTGPAGYAAYYMAYFPEDGMATHNNVIDILAQTGIFGLGFCAWFFAALAWLGYKVCRRLKGRGDFSEVMANVAFAGTIGCIVMMVFGDWLFPFTYTQTIAGFDYVVYSWLFMGAIPVLDRLTRLEPGATAVHA